MVTLPGQKPMLIFEDMKQMCVGLFKLGQATSRPYITLADLFLQENVQPAKTDNYVGYYQGELKITHINIHSRGDVYEVVLSPVRAFEPNHIEQLSLDLSTHEDREWKSLADDYQKGEI